MRASSSLRHTWHPGDTITKLAACNIIQHDQPASRALMIWERNIFDIFVGDKKRATICDHLQNLLLLFIVNLLFPLCCTFLCLSFAPKLLKFLTTQIYIIRFNWLYEFILKSKQKLISRKCKITTTGFVVLLLLFLIRCTALLYFDDRCTLNWWEISYCLWINKAKSWSFYSINKHINTFTLQHLAEQKQHHANIY